MAETPQGARQGRKEARYGDWVKGLALFAGFALGLSGLLSVVSGCVGIVHDTLFGTPPYAYAFDLTAWGWLHVAIGIALLLAGAGVLAGKNGGRWAGVAVGAVSLVTQFMFIPHYPVWALCVMVLDLVAIWALSRLSTS
jgi:hypothetical protein